METVISLVIAISIIVLVAFHFFTAKRETLPDNSVNESNGEIQQNSSIDAKKENTITGLTHHLYKRHIDAKKQAQAVLFSTVFVLLIGATFFYFASDIALRDSRAEEILSATDIKEKVEKNFINTYVKNHNINIDSLRELADKTSLSYKDPSTSDNPLTSENYKAEKEISAIRSNALQAYALEIDSVILARSPLLAKSKDSFSRWNKLITTISLRVIICLLIFYLSQIFLKMYRYNLKVSDFYINRYEAIICNKELGLDFIKSAELFEHKIDIGQQPKSPFEMALNILRALNENQKSQK